MYLMPSPSVSVGAVPVFPRKRGVSMSGLGCNCRGGNYLTGLGQDTGSSWQEAGAAVAVAQNPNLINNPAAGLTPVDTALPPELSPNPVEIPLPQPTANVPLSAVAPPAIAPNVQSLATAPPILPGGSPGLPAAYPDTLPNPAPPQKNVSWANQQPYLGVPNKFIVGGVLAILVIAAAAKKGTRS
jgi:hypothetical protein